MRRTFSTLIFAVIVFSCAGQSFLVKYDALRSRDLPAFFADWMTYSDSVRVQNIVTDSVIADVLACEYAENADYVYGKTRPKYLVFPQELTVHRFYIDTDSIKDEYGRGWYNNLNGIDEEKHSAYVVTPEIPKGALYLTDGIYRLLAEFLGGLRVKVDIPEVDSEKDDDDEDEDEYGARPEWTFSEINFKNLKTLEKYIQAVYDHWGGYWWFTSFPAILDFYYANDKIYVDKKYGFSSGQACVYNMVDGKFVKNPRPVGVWIQ